jgi:D-alanine-D-alanine ligase
MAPKKIQKYIEIVRSTTKELSSQGIESANGMYDVLSRHYAHVGVTIVNCAADLRQLSAKRPDLVFLGVKCVPVDPRLGLRDPAKVWVADFLDQHGIASTGSNGSAHELELNKPMAKQRVLEAGLATAPFFVASQDTPLVESAASLAFPVFIKPTNRGGGSGIDHNSLAHDFAGLRAKVATIAADLRSDSLVEEYLAGREFSVSILKDEYSAAYVIMPIELVAPADEQGTRILSGAIKSADSEQSMAVGDDNMRETLSALAMDIFIALGARDYGRIDIRLDHAGAPHFLEANLIPSLVNHAGNYFPKACLLALGLSYDATILHIARLGLARAAQVDITEDETDTIAIYSAALPAAA